MDTPTGEGEPYDTQQLCKDYVVDIVVRVAYCFATVPLLETLVKDDDADGEQDDVAGDAVGGDS